MVKRYKSKGGPLFQKDRECGSDSGTGQGGGKKDHQRGFVGGEAGHLKYQTRGGGGSGRRLL